ncbi:response regulator transcription factor [Aquibacillus salsiterrae]|uniref:Response regulator transcription factor n=1 Tax=Aquibacillus salsiterrae TaxID=2950439 RepID=A0A9X3WBW9_9BACI|nr:response regulator transcription factor [Aquibacillus salsiterrae]MDC3416882.1 response regulator transcription factor [Aquibacillus salsiterrae]
MLSPKVVILDQEEEERASIRYHLEMEGYRIKCLKGGCGAVGHVLEENPDLIITDVLLPEIDGIELCKQLRNYTDIPIIIVSAKSDTEDKVIGLNAGSDDYIAKPFNPIELVARVNAHIRRSNLMRQKHHQLCQQIKHGDLVIDLSSQLVNINDELVILSAREFKLLTQLARFPGRIFRMDELYEHVWGTKTFVDTGTVMVHISNLRKKLHQKNPTFPYIVTVRGAGYKFNENV